MERICFEAIPQVRSDKDLYLFAAIFHAMGNDEARQILTNLKKACTNHRPTIVIADMLAQEEHIDPSIASFDLQMLIGTHGRERTLQEWHELLEPTGFMISEIVEVRSFARLLVLQL
ncbi:MAG: methyltransferase [Candidatus Thiodiazotropha sp.]